MTCEGKKCEMEKRKKKKISMVSVEKVAARETEPCKDSETHEKLTTATERKTERI